MYLFFDTETNSLPKNYNAPVTDVDNWPRIIQLAWAAFNDEGRKYASWCGLITPDGWEVPKEEFWIKHGYSTEKNQAEGTPIKTALTHLIEFMEQSRFIIAHNMSFDSPIIGAEMIRAQMRPQNKPTKICTMKASTNFCKIPSSRGYKWPKLEELYLKLFNKKFEGAHDALNDVLACAESFFELKKLGVISLESKEKVVNPFQNIEL